MPASDHNTTPPDTGVRWGDPFAPDRLANPYINMDELLDDGYVTYHEDRKRWYILGYDEVTQAARSSSLGIQKIVPNLFRRLDYSKLSPETKEAITNWVIMNDPPNHTRLRRLTSLAFTRTRLEALRPKIKAITNELLSAIEKDPKPDIVDTLIAPLPVYVIAEILGLPKERWQWLHSVSSKMILPLDATRGFDPHEVDTAFKEFAHYLTELIPERRKNPQDDILSTLVAKTDQQEELTEPEIISIIGFLLLAGHETTTGALGNSIIALASFPEQRTLLHTQQVPTTQAVEELLRFDSPVLTATRIALEDVTIGNKVIPARSLVVMNLGIANRDNRKHPDPNQLRLNRENPKPISFGQGIHYCIGAGLARIELEIAIPAFLNSFGQYKINTKQTKWNPSLLIRRPTSLPVTRQPGVP